jgi:catechol 2,3-dioxygenase-like lactoylglutathione lyase family enzyme
MTHEGHEQPTARVTSSVLFVSRLDRSIAFYRDVFSCEETIRDRGAALLLAPDGFQIYLIARGDRAEHPSGGIGCQYLVWAVDNVDQLRELERIVQRRGGQTRVHTSGGVSFLATRDPDDIRILVAQPSPARLPRSVLGAHLYV